MKKVLALILALALVFAMGTTAWAAENQPSADDETQVGTNNTGDTNVKIIAADTQLSVTIPLNVTLAVAADGTVTGPTNYKIVNNSIFAVKVTDIALEDSIDFTPTAGPFETVATYTSGADKLVLTLTPDEATAIQLTDTLTFPAENIAQALEWNLNAKEGTTADEIVLAIAGTAHNLSAAYDTATTAFVLTFTVEAGTHPGA